jgi:hypothetical protein
MSEHQAQSRVSADVPVGGRTGRLPGTALTVSALGLVLCLMGLSTAQGRQSLGFAYLLGFSFLWITVLGCLFFVCLHHVIGAVWSVVVRRVAEMFAWPMGLVAILFVPILIFCWSDAVPLFPWLRPDPGDALLAQKLAYLNPGFFTLRAILFLCVWMAFSRYFVGRSLRQDHRPDLAVETVNMRRLSGPFMPIFALTLSFASVDWLMSTEPHWYSTIYGVYIFAGMACVSLSVITLTVVWLRSTGWLGQGIVRDEHLYNLGVLLFTFVCFWGYIWMSQYMLIWYGNLSEETIFFFQRGWSEEPSLRNGWTGLSVLQVLVRFVIPFFLLLSRRAKTNGRSLAIISIFIIFGQVVDLYWLIMPDVYPDGPKVVWTDAGPLLLMVGLLLGCVARFMRKYRCLATGDPLYARSCAFHLTL